MTDFIGRAEPQTKLILSRLLSPDIIKIQVPLYTLIPILEFNLLDPEVQKHKFDMVLYKKNTPHLIVEVNFKHGEKAAKKWRTIFKPLLEKYHHQTLTIDDYECSSLFKPQDYTTHILSWDDIQDVCNALKTQHIKYSI